MLFAPPPPNRTSLWVVGAVAVVAVIAVGTWLVGSRRAPAPAPAPTTGAAGRAHPPPAVAVTESASTTASEPEPTVPRLAGSPQQDAPSAAEPGETEYRAAVQAAREANAASKWELEAEEYRRALAVRPTSLEAKEGLGSAIVKSSGRAGSYLEAERLLADVVTVDAGRSRAWLVLGMARQLGARPGPAIEAYKRYLELVPEGPVASDVRAVVRELDRRSVAERRPGR
jgi:Flp pilus assembly protein TadD